MEAFQTFHSWPNFPITFSGWRTLAHAIHQSSIHGAIKYLNSQADDEFKWIPIRNIPTAKPLALSLNCFVDGSQVVCANPTNGTVTATSTAPTFFSPPPAPTSHELLSLVIVGLLLLVLALLSGYLLASVTLQLVKWRSDSDQPPKHTIDLKTRDVGVQAARVVVDSPPVAPLAYSDTIVVSTPSLAPSSSPPSPPAASNNLSVVSPCTTLDIAPTTATYPQHVDASVNTGPAEPGAPVEEDDEQEEDDGAAPGASDKKKRRKTRRCRRRKNQQLEDGTEASSSLEAGQEQAESVAGVNAAVATIESQQ